MHSSGGTCIPIGCRFLHFSAGSRRFEMQTEGDIAVYNTRIRCITRFTVEKRINNLEVGCFAFVSESI